MGELNQVKSTYSVRYLRLGFIFVAVGITGIFLVFFLTRITDLLIFTIVFYPFISLIVVSIILVLGGIRKIAVSKNNFLKILIILIGGVVFIIGLDLLFGFLVMVL